CGTPLIFSTNSSLGFEFVEKINGVPHISALVCCITLGNLPLEIGVLKFEVIFELVNIHYPDQGDAVFLEDYVLLAHMDAADDRPKVDARFGEWETVDHSFCGHEVPVD